MAQHDFDIANASGASVRSDINNALSAIVTNNSGTAAPSTTFAHQWWFDTTNSLLKQRNEANDAWITVASKVGNVWIPYANGVALQIGSAIGNLIAWEDLGDTAATPAYPPGDGSLITGLSQGAVLQVAHSQVLTQGTGTTTVPVDDTIPQNTEGNEIITCAITPISATSKLLIEVSLMVAFDADATLVFALFQDSTANALYAIADKAAGTNDQLHTIMRHYMTAGTTSATTFKARVGSNSAGTLTWNGAGGNRRFGGVAACRMTITEIAA